jgi:hypothetical protein
MTTRMPPQLIVPAEVSVALTDAAVKIVRATAAATLRRRATRGRTLRPGVDTPLWNALLQAAHAQLKKRGERAHLARILGLPRQRITEMFRAKTHLPDAERALLLLAWLHARYDARDLG